MAASRTLLLRPVLRTTTLAAGPRHVLPATTRLINSASDPALFTAQATTTGGRASGHVKSPHFDLHLGMPKELGGDGAKSNPEELFAAGYGACFQGAMSASAASMGVKMSEKAEDNIVDAKVSLLGNPKKLDFGLRVELKVKLRGVSREEAEKVIEKTKEVCPYSRATKGNVVTTVELEVL